MNNNQWLMDIFTSPEGQLQAPQSEYFPPAPLATCRRCESAFSFDPKRGRPRAYCSPKCRRAAKLEQTAGWKVAAAAAREVPPETCANCHSQLRQRAGVHGRFKRFCGQACRKRLAARGGQQQMDFMTPSTNREDRSDER